MKLKSTLFLVLSGILTLGLSSCLKDSCERQLTYIKVTPVYKTVDEIRAGTVVNEAPRDLKNPGKIYYLNDFLFINENREGVHVIDNSNPNAPENIAFISIPGNDDIAIKDGLLYASSYIDLLTIDVSNIFDAKLIDRTENIFPPEWEDLNTGELIVYYEEEQVTEIVDCEAMGNFWESSGGIWFGCPSCNVFSGVAFDESTSIKNGSGATGSGTGLGGSMARFSIIGNYLYSVDETELDVISLNNPTEPNLVNTIDLGWGIETIFPYEDKLFIGSNTGMFIYDNSNPEAPAYLSDFQHARACDPVFVKDNYAYVTLRDGTLCEGFNNQLDLIDISDITAPKLERTFQMDNPHGLSIKDNSLFICEGTFGLKAFDISEPETLNQRLLSHDTNLHAFDAISLPGDEDILMVIGNDGFFQYDFEDPSNLKLLSTIPVRK
jgi:hypothetical protein